MASVYIPVQNSEEEVRVALDQLPRDASDILDILKAEQAPLDLWLIIAVRSYLSVVFFLFNLSYSVIANCNLDLTLRKFRALHSLAIMLLFFLIIIFKDLF